MNDTRTSVDSLPADPFVRATSDPTRAAPEWAAKLAAHPAPAAAVNAVVRHPDMPALILIVNPGYKEHWDLPGGMVEVEEPTSALQRELLEELRLPVTVDRLLAVDMIPADRWGRPIISLLYAARPDGPVGEEDLVLQRTELSEARFVTEPEALDLLAPPVAARLKAALDAARGQHTAHLRDGHPTPTTPRDRYQQMPAPLTHASVLLRDPHGRVLLLEPTHGGDLELPGSMVESDETPGEAAARGLGDGLGLDVPVGRLLAVDSVPASMSRHGRALTCHVYDAAPVTAEQEAEMLYLDGQICDIRRVDPLTAGGELPALLASRIAAALRAVESGTTVQVDRAGNGPGAAR